MQEILQEISNFGFPIILSMYLLTRLESKMEQLTTSIQNLSRVINKNQ